MSFKGIMYKRLETIFYPALRAIVDLSLNILKRLRLRSVHRLADGMGDIFYFLNRSYRRRLINHLRFALGNERSDRDIREIARRSVRNLVRAPVEMIYLCLSTPDGVGKRMVLEGKDYLDQALAKGRGVIGLGAHFGNFMAMGARLTHDGYVFNIVLKDPTEEWYPGWGQALRNQARYKTIPLRPRELCARKILKALKNNEIVYMVTDDNKPSGGVFVDFFGKKAATATGPATLSLKIGAPILPMFSIWQPDKTLKVIIESPLKVDLSGDRDRDVRMITQVFTKVIEDYVRNYPDHWGWGRKRWKTQPKEV